jgi:hypothetical protein
MSDLDVILPTTKLNDWNYVHRVLLTVKLDVILLLSKKNNKDFPTLVKEFIPELENFEDEELFKKYNLSSTMFGFDKELPIKKKNTKNAVKEIININSNEKPTVLPTLNTTTLTTNDTTKTIEKVDKPTKIIKKKIVVNKVETKPIETVDNNINNNINTNIDTNITNESIDDLTSNLNNLNISKPKPIKIVIKKKIENNQEQPNIIKADLPMESMTLNSEPEPINSDEKKEVKKIKIKKLINKSE